MEKKTLKNNVSSYLFFSSQGRVNVNDKRRKCQSLKLHFLGKNGRTTSRISRICIAAAVHSTALLALACFISIAYIENNALGRARRALLTRQEFN